MGRKTGIERLSAREVQVAKADANDGGGLWLRMPRGNSAGGPIWCFRYTFAGKRPEMSLGPVAQASIALAGASLTDARKAAARARALLADGIDPLAKKRADEAAAKAEAERAKAAAKAERMTLRRWAHRYVDDVIEPSHMNEKHKAQWASTVLKLLPADLLEKPVGEINPRELLAALATVCKRTPETGRRLTQRVRVLFDAAVVEGLRDDNPALPIKTELARRVGTQRRGHFAAMPYAQLPSFIERLRQTEGTSARALEFAIATAGRTSEVLKAEWAEIDVQARTWTVPDGKMKAREAHLVFLNDTALRVLEGQREHHGKGKYVFPSARSDDGDAPMSQMALLMVMRRMGEPYTVHGFRATYSTACNELALARRDAIEASLAHRQKDRTEAAYNRAAFLAERKALAAAWCEFIEGRWQAPDNVIPMQRVA